VINNNWKKHHKDSLASLQKLACVTEDIVKESLTKMSPFPSESYHSKKANILINLHPVAAARCSFQLLSTDSLISAKSLENSKIQEHSCFLLQAQSLVPELHQEVLNSVFPQVLKDGFIVTGAQQLEENFSRQKYEI
jgi:hypothetical protein